MVVTWADDANRTAERGWGCWDAMRAADGRSWGMLLEAALCGWSSGVTSRRQYRPSGVVRGGRFRIPANRPGVRTGIPSREGPSPLPILLTIAPHSGTTIAMASKRWPISAPGTRTTEHGST